MQRISSTFSLLLRPRMIDSNKLTPLVNFSSTLRATSSQKVTTEPRQAVTLKLSTPPELHSVFSPELKKLIHIFEKCNHEFRIVGGAVRDLLMQKFPLEIDCSTTATPQQMLEMFKDENLKIISNKGELYGTVCVEINENKRFQITTLRTDLATDGRYAVVEFVKDWSVDACRRDFTINTLSLDRHGTVYDYFNAIEDINKRSIKFLGDPATRIKEDCLRILRYFRFYGRFATDANSLDPDVLKEIKRNPQAIDVLAGPRIWNELRKILTGNFHFELMRIMLEVGLGPHMGLPVNFNLKEFDALRERVCGPLEAITIITSLLNNKEEFEAFDNRMNLCKRERDLGYFIINHREDKLNDDILNTYKRHVLVTEDNYYRTREQVEQVLIYRGEIKVLNEFKNWQPPRCPVTTSHLLDRGMKSGNLMNKVLLEIKKRWFDSSLTLTEKGLLVDFEEILAGVATKKKKRSKGKKMAERALNSESDYY